MMDPCKNKDSQITAQSPPGVHPGTQQQHHLPDQLEPIFHERLCSRVEIFHFAFQLTAFVCLPS